MEWPQFFSWLMDREGRVVTNDHRDPGGQTCWGISRRYHPHWPGWAMVDAGATDMADMVSGFYRANYLHLWDVLPERVREVAVDTAVNMGTEYAVKCLQLALNRLAKSSYVSIDGKLGPQTREAVRYADAPGLAFTMCALRLAEYGRRGRTSDARRVFLDGWINRVRMLMEVI